MHIVHGEDLFEEIGVADIIFVSAANTIKDGKIAMTGFAARKLAKLYPELPAAFGNSICDRKKTRKVYGIEQTTEMKSRNKSKLGPLPLISGKTQFGLFQCGMKDNDIASRDIIQQSVTMLCQWADKWERIAMNLPGTGTGALPEEMVLPIIDKLPDNVFVYVDGAEEDLVVAQLAPMMPNLKQFIRPMSEADYHRR